MDEYHEPGLAMTPPSLLVLGAGPAGLCCAIEAARRGLRVRILDHNDRAGRKLQVTGGGRCNFTNRDVSPGNYISENPRFVHAALHRRPPADVLRWITQAGIATHERAHGQLFCDDSAQQILNLLTREAAEAGARTLLRHRVLGLERLDAGGFSVSTDQGELQADAVVVATGGLSYPRLGASGIGIEIARSLGLPIISPRPALVPFTFPQAERALFATLAGNSLEVEAWTGSSPRFRDQALFTHRGLSGPAILQVSSWWQPGAALHLDLLPGLDIPAFLAHVRASHPRMALRTALDWKLPKGLVQALRGSLFPDRALGELLPKEIEALCARLHQWTLRPAGTEGYAVAEVSAGGVDTRVLTPATLEVRGIPGLHFVGEVVDVTGWLGGYNLQWAWSSGWCAGRAVGGSRGGSG